MGPVGHSAISTVIGASVWGVTGSPLAGGVTVAAGVAVDIDHLLDYYQLWVKRRNNKVYVLFHAWEYSFLGFLVLGFWYYHPILLAGVLAHLGHVATDHFHNRLTPLGYFILYRVWVRFESKKIASGAHSGHSYRDLPDLFPFRRIWEPCYRRKIEPWIAARVDSAPRDPESQHQD